MKNQNEFFELNVESLTDKDWADLNLMVKDLLKRKVFKCQKKALIAAYINWVAFRLELDTLCFEDSKTLH